MDARVAAFISRRWRVAPELCRVELQPMHGGLESTVTRARLVTPGAHASLPPQFVVKQLRAACQREADVYDVLWAHAGDAPTVRVLGRERAGGTTYLYLEEAQPSDSWPWADARRAGAVCRALARLHDNHALPRGTFAWDYEQELVRSAQETVALARDARDAGGQRCWRRLGDLRRVAGALPRVRQRLLSHGTVVIHGDMHPGNVILRDGCGPQVVLIDWARARLGSPLEDIASWLHSLGCWEPEARRRHDTLMRTYLEARATPRQFRADVRVDYWLASACNGLSGAIRYHLAVLSNRGSSEAARYDSHRALAAWTRVIRRAAVLLNTIPDRRS